MKLPAHLLETFTLYLSHLLWRTASFTPEAIIMSGKTVRLQRTFFMHRNLSAENLQRRCNGKCSNPIHAHKSKTATQEKREKQENRVRQHAYINAVCNTPQDMCRKNQLWALATLCVMAMCTPPWWARETSIVGWTEAACMGCQTDVWLPMAQYLSVQTNDGGSLHKCLWSCQHYPGLPCNRVQPAFVIGERKEGLAFSIPLYKWVRGILDFSKAKALHHF